MTAPASPAFRVGQVVGLRADQGRCGPVIAELTAVAGQARYTVFHGPGEVRTYYADQLVAVDQPPSLDVFAEALAAGSYLDGRTFRARLAAARLSHPLTDTLYALRAARIRWIPFQFKPLLRFLRADRPRILISDDVGVGKTIEAGLILKELEARQQLDSVLVVCPKALVPKWRMEMRRFDEEFRVLTPDVLRYCLQETANDGAWPAQYGRAIVSLELLRVERYLEGEAKGRRRIDGLLALDPPPQFGLLIVDEAHHLRNRETKSHELARFLCDVSEAAVFLTATPVQLGAGDLYTLLNLLRPDLFRDEGVFNVMVEPNRHISQAIRLLRAGGADPEWQMAAQCELQAAASTEWGRRSLGADPRFATWLDRLEDRRPLGVTERIRGLRDLEEVHSLALVMNRTRRRDIGAFTVREPHTVSVPFTAAQGVFYHALVAFRRQMMHLRHDPRVVALVMDTLERQASSCLPALVPALDAFLRHGRFSVTSVTDSDEETGVDETVPEVLRERAAELRRMAAELPDEDPKLGRFLSLVRDAMASDGPRKMLVFSYFLHSLAYLERHLKDAGVRVGMVTGRIPDEERETLRELFRKPHAEPDAIDVLLSSEVGCEGLDYEFCDQLVNYDLPWNPMRVEQRIGRIDRFGQRSPKVAIFNFITPGTVEERVFHRCFERLGIFRDTVGDLEEVLGELVHDLTLLAYDSALTPEQAEIRALQLADNVVRLAEERRRLEKEGGVLAGLESAMEAEVQDLLGDGRYVGPAELQGMIDVFLAMSGAGGRLVPDEATPGLFTLRLIRDTRRAVGQRVRSLGRKDRATAELLRWLDGEEPGFRLTFDQDLALERRELPFVTPVHPLAQVAMRGLASEDPLVTTLHIGSDVVSPGRYLFACELWETVGARREVRLVGFGVDLATRQASAALSPALLRLLAGGADGRTPADRDEIGPSFQVLDEAIRASHEAELEELRGRNDLVINQRLAGLETYHRQRLDRVEADLRQNLDERIQRMRRSERARIERDYERLRQELESRRAADIVGHRLAAGVLVVDAPEEVRTSVK